MTKNKKGKKNNKMAGRTRPTREQTQDPEGQKVSVVLSDTSEIEDPGNHKGDLETTTTDLKDSASDSGFDSGRGSPGDVSGAGAAVGDCKKVGEENVTEAAMEGNAPAVGPESAAEVSPKPAVNRGPEPGSRAQTSSVKTDDPWQTAPTYNFGDGIENKVESKAENNVAIKTKENAEIKTGDDSEIKAGDDSEVKTEDKAGTRTGHKVEIKTEDKAKIETKDESKEKTDGEVKRDRPRDGGKDRRVEETVAPDTKPDNSGDSPPVAVRSKGASSLKRPKNQDDIKHPLEFPWEFWVVRHDLPWNEALRPCASFDTAEDFWLYFSPVSDPGIFNKPILLFKKNIRPEWEDIRNTSGGRWNFINGVKGQDAADVWRELALLLIGGIRFGCLTPHLNGIYCTHKDTGKHFSVWIDTLESDIAMEIGQIIQDSLYSVLHRSFHLELVPSKSDKRKRPMATLR